jgi:hypothetical protein
VELEATREDGERRERSPEERDVDRLCEARLASECEDRPWCREDVMSMLPPPNVGRLAIFKRSEFKVSIWVWDGKAPCGGTRVTVPTSWIYEYRISSTLLWEKVTENGARGCGLDIEGGCPSPT